MHCSALHSPFHAKAGNEASKTRSRAAHGAQDWGVLDEGAGAGATAALALTAAASTTRRTARRAIVATCAPNVKHNLGERLLRTFAHKCLVGAPAPAELIMEEQVLVDSHKRALVCFYHM